MEDSTSTARLAEQHQHEQEAHDQPTTLQFLLGHDAELLSLPAFLTKYVPQFELPPAVEQKDVVFHRTFVSPFRQIPHLQNIFGKIGKPVVGESLSSLVDNVVSTLVIRREQQKRVREDGKNLLCQGFVVASEELASSGAQSMRNMPSGILSMNMNNNVEYIKTNPLFRKLHIWVGDSVLRALLLNCRIFVPIGNDRDNYLQLAGPPLRVRTKIGSTRHSPDELPCKKKRKRKRRNRKATAPPNPPAPSKLAPTATIRKNPLMFSNSYVPHIGLPTNHILQQSKNPFDVLADMVHIRDRNGNLKKKLWKRLRRRGLDVCQNILHNHKKCDYPRLLERYCPLPTCISKTKHDNLNLATLSSSFCPPASVSSFVKAVVKRIFTQEVWGCAHNVDCIMNLIDRFVEACRQEHLTNIQLLEGIRVKELRWLRAEDGAKFSRSDHDHTKQLVLLVQRWVLEKFVIPLLHSCFHVTETEFTGKRLMYYRKPVWVHFRSLAMKKLLTSQYKEISPAEAAERLKHQKMGFSQLRLLPKETGVRPIAQLSKPMGICFDTDVTSEAEGEDDAEEKRASKRQRRGDSIQRKSARIKLPSTNAMLKEAFAILRHEYERDNSLVGSGLDGLHQFYSRYLNFIEKVNPRSNENVQLFFGSVDIRHCFDSIDQQKMLSILDDILSQEEYSIQGFTQYRPYESMSRTLKLPKTNVGRPEDIKPFHSLVESLATTSYKTVFVDGGNCSVSRSQDLRKLIEQHLTGHLVLIPGRHGDRYLLQCNGVPQGSTLSTLLCNFYYGNIERKILNRAVSPGSQVPQLCCRLVDDFLFIGTSYKMLQSSLGAMLEGDPALGVVVNEEKSKVSTSVKVPRCDGGVEAITPDGTRRYFPWCGMLLDVKTGEVMVDYRRFENDKASNSITIDHSLGKGEEMLQQLKSFIRPRCIPILFDRRINSPTIQQTNFFQMMVYAAIKLVIYLRAKRVSTGGGSNVSFLLTCIDMVISYAATLIRSQLDQVDAQWDVTPRQQRYLGRKAFHSVFNTRDDLSLIASAIEKSLASKKPTIGLDAFCRRSLRFMQYHKLLPANRI